MPGHLGGPRVPELAGEWFNRQHCDDRQGGGDGDHEVVAGHPGQDDAQDGDGGAAVPADPERSALARRPYDLRHAAVSTWLNAGVPATQVAEWAGHSVHVLLEMYAKCIDGQDEAARRRIEAALGLAAEAAGA